MSGNHRFAKAIDIERTGGVKTVLVKAVDSNTGEEVTIGSRILSFPMDGNKLPTGNMELFTTDNNQLSIHGWIYDPNSINEPVILKVYVDDNYVGEMTTDYYRDDVNKAMNIQGTHGFNGRFDVSLTGSHNVTVYAVDVNTQETKLFASKKFTFNQFSENKQNPIGCIDELSLSNDKLNIHGWAYDPDHDTQEIEIQVYVDGQKYISFNTDYYREDTNKTMGITGTHGFSKKLVYNLTGSHKIDIYAIDLDDQSMKLLTSKNLTSGIQFKLNANLDIVKDEKGKVYVGGWAYNRYEPNKSLVIHVKIGNTLIGTITANSNSLDVSKIYGVGSSCRFSGLFNTTLTGKQTISVYAYDENTNQSYLIGSKSINLDLNSIENTVNIKKVASTNVYGCLDGCVGLDSCMYIYGWALDPDNPSLSSYINIYINGSLYQRISTSVLRSDVNQTFKATNNHGYALALPINAGTYTIEVTALDLNTLGEVSLGKKNVTITNKSKLTSIALNELGNGPSKYTSWYGVSSSTAWCMIFTSWVGSQAGVLGTKFPKSAYVPTVINWCKKNNRYYTTNPQKGDLIFFGNGSHIGIVLGTDGSRIFTIEGNNSNLVRVAVYSCSDSRITGYGSTK